MDNYRVHYKDTDGLTEEIDVEADDVFDAEEAAREELTAKSPSVDTDEWEILKVEALENAPAPR